jgi:hypothetical protein
MFENPLQSTYEIRLLDSKQVQVIFLSGLIPFPDTSTKRRSPVTRGDRLAVLGESLGLSPDVPIPLGVVFGGTGFLEPFVLVGSAEKQIGKCVFTLVQEILAYWLTTKSKTILIPRSWHPLIRAMQSSKEPYGSWISW